MEKTSRVKKYKELRDGIRDEVGVSHEPVETKVEEEDDEFLSFVNKTGKQGLFEDTLAEAQTYEQMQEEDNEELQRALRSVKSSVGKDSVYNTRMDIMNKIRNPQKAESQIDHMETADFAQGFFVTQEDIEDDVEEEVIEPEEKSMTLMERLASISPREDAKKVEQLSKEDNEEEEIEEELMPQEDTSMEESVEWINEMDHQEEERTIENKIDPLGFSDDDEEETLEEKPQNTLIINILNYIIIALVIVFIVLLGLIGYQLFF